MSSTIRTEILGLDLSLDDDASLAIVLSGEQAIAPVPLSPDDAERLRLEMSKAQLWEWNQLEGVKARAELRYRRYFGSWLVLCLAAFSAYVGYPGYIMPMVFILLSIFLWWRAGYEEQRAEREAQAQRNEFRADWKYIRERLEEKATPFPQ